MSLDSDYLTTAGLHSDSLHTDYPKADRGTIVVWGLFASLPFGGMTWQALHYLVGLRRLGFDVWYVEDSDRVVYDPESMWPTLDYVPNAAHLDRFMKSVGLGDRWVFRPPEVWDECLGATDIAGLRDLYRRADAVINLCGAQELHSFHDSISCLIYLQTDPTADQVRVAQGDRSKIAELEAYDYLFTYAENIGAPDCRIPVDCFEWHTTRPPVLIDWWHTGRSPSTGTGLTTITNWKYFAEKDVTWSGESWSWNKQDEIRRFIELPERSALQLEMAMSAIDERDQDFLRSHGWHVRPAGPLSDPCAYRGYIQQSLGELTVAKEQYTIPNTGWFSDRSVCYLAAGRPVITQNTGFGRHVPSGEGLFAFDTEDEALAAIDRVASDYPRHAEAAVELAREYFGVDRVLRDLLSQTHLLA